MTIREMREALARLITNARSKFDEIKDDTPEERAAEIEREFDAMMADANALEAKIARQEQIESAEARMQSGDSRRPNGENGEARGDTNDDEPVSYRDAFHAMMANAGNVGLISPEERAVLHAGFRAIEEQRAQTTTNAAGGYTVPTELQAIIIQSMAAWGPMYDDDLCTVINTAGGGSLPLPTVDDTTKTAGAHTEGATLTDDGGKDVVFGQKELGSYMFDTEWLRVSLELAQDSILGMEQLLGSLLGERLGRIANLQLTTGTGSGAPNGIVTASGLGKTTAATAAITADEILDLFHSVDPAYRASPKSRFMFNDATLLAIHKLKDGQGNYLISEAPDGQGRLRVGAVSAPYSINQAVDSLAAAKKVMVYGDFGKYFVRKVGDTIVGALSDKDFWPGYGVAGYVRLDGELGDTAAVKHLITAAV